MSPGGAELEYDCWLPTSQDTGLNRTSINFDQGRTNGRPEQGYADSDGHRNDGASDQPSAPMQTAHFWRRDSRYEYSVGSETMAPIKERMILGCGTPSSATA